MKLSHDIARKLESEILNQPPSIEPIQNERELAEHFQTSRSTIREALQILVSNGLLIRKNRSGYYVNHFIYYNQEFYHRQSSSPISLTKAYQDSKQSITTQVLLYELIPCPESISKKLLLSPSENVFHIKRLRSIDNNPFLIDECYIHEKYGCHLSLNHISNSLIKSMEESMNESLIHSSMILYSDCSTQEDQSQLNLEVHEPVTVSERILLNNNGIPIMHSTVRQHYKTFKFIVNI